MRGRAATAELWGRISPETTGDSDDSWELALPGAERPSVRRDVRFLVITADAAEVTPLSAVLRFLAVTGWPLEIWHGAGQVPQELAAVAREIPPLAHHSRRGRSLDPLLPAWDVGKGGADHLVVPMGWRARLGRVLHRRADILTTHPVAALAAAVFAEAAARPRLRGSDLTAVLDAAELLGPEAVPTLGWALVRQRVLPWADPRQLERFARAAQRCGVDQLDIGAVAEGGLGDSETRAALSRAESHLEHGWTRPAALVAAAGLRQLFDRSRHVHASSSPLITEPDVFLRPLSDARSMLTPATVDDDAPAAGAAGGRPLILSGAYPAFSQGLVAALGGAADRLDLGSIEARFHNTEMEARSLAELFAVDRGGAVTSPGGIALQDAMAEASVVVADWADKGAALASRLVRPGQRLVVRVNGVDHLSAWFQLIRWDRVDDVIVVSEHVRRAIDAYRLPGMSRVRRHVIPHALAPGAGDVGGDVTDHAGRDRTLGLIGWAQAVKDPVFALDTLGLLRAQDPRWRLVLIGPLLAEGAAADDRFTRRVEQRLQAADVRGAVEMTGALDHEAVLALLPRIGYGLSTSRRESLHMGALEMVAAGAVPVVRDWPLYAALDGAATVFGAEAVVTTPAQAVQLIRRLDEDRAERARIVETAQERVLREHDPGRVATRLAAVVGQPGAAGPMA